jgi:hypothetical protein
MPSGARAASGHRAESPLQVSGPVAGIRPRASPATSRRPGPTGMPTRPDDTAQPDDRLAPPVTASARRRCLSTDATRSTDGPRRTGRRCLRRPANRPNGLSPAHTSVQARPHTPRAGLSTGSTQGYTQATVPAPVINRRLQQAFFPQPGRRRCTYPQTRHGSEPGLPTARGRIAQLASRPARSCPRRQSLPEAGRSGFPTGAAVTHRQVTTALNWDNTESPQLSTGCTPSCPQTGA